jgi:hypothetical protein
LFINDHSIQKHDADTSSPICSVTMHGYLDLMIELLVASWPGLICRLWFTTVPSMTKSTTPPWGHPATPEAGSLRDILLKHCRQRLYVHPLLWTEDHLRLLDCLPPQVARASCSCFCSSSPAHTMLSTNHYAIASSIHSSLKRLVLPESRDIKIRQLIRFLAQSIQTPAITITTS